MIVWWQYDNLCVLKNIHGLRGVFSNNNIEAESLIIKEKAIIGSSQRDLANKIKNDGRFLDLYPNYNHLKSKLMSLVTVQYNHWNHIADSVSIYLHCSLINHSCAPNAVFIRDQKEGKLYALRNIKAGEEITVSYVTESIGSKLPYNERQLELQTWMPKCLCDICIMDNTIETHQKLKELVDNNYNHLLNIEDILADDNDDETSSNDIDKSLSIISK